MAKKCSLCGKKVPVFGAAKLEDGVLCKDCARKIKTGAGDIDWKNTSTDDAKRIQKANAQKKRQTLIILACVMAVCLGVICLLPDRSDHRSTSAPTTSQEEKTPGDEMTAEEKTEEKPNEDTIPTSPKEYPSLVAGETASFEGFDITVGNPTETIIRESTKDYYIGSCSNAFIIVPVKVVAKGQTEVSINSFPDCVLEISDGYFPEKLTMVDGETYTGNLLVPWACGYEGNTSSLAAPVGEGPIGVSYTDGRNTASWVFDYDTETPKSVDAGSISKVFPNQMIQATGVLEHVDSYGGTVLIRLKVGDKSVEANVDSEKADEWAAMEGQTITFTGRVKNLTVNVENTFQGEYVVLTDVIMK